MFTTLENQIQKNITYQFYLIVPTGKNVIMASTEGGMDIETVAEETPDKIVKEWIDPAVGLQGFQARKVAFALGTSKVMHSKEWLNSSLHYIQGVRSHGRISI